MLDPKRVTETPVSLTRRVFVLGGLAVGGCSLVDTSSPPPADRQPDVDGTDPPAIGEEPRLDDEPVGITPDAPTGVFGNRLTLGPVADVQQAVADGGGWLYVPEGRMWVVAVPEEAIEPLTAATDVSLHGSYEVGLAVLFQTCPHLGCRIPECTSSGMFECPCHGSHYGRLGEKREGPAPRGMDRFPAWVDDDGLVVVDTGNLVRGVPIGTDLGSPPDAGPGCV